MRISRSLAVTALVALVFLSAKPPASSRCARQTEEPTDEDSANELDAAFVYDVVTRFNEFGRKHFAIDTAVTAVLAGNVAIAVFAIDKIREFRHTEECWAISLLSGSLLTCLVAYAIGFPFGGTAREGVLPSRFVPDVVVRQATAVSSAIETVVQAAMFNLTVRVWKRALVVAAILLLLAGGAVVTLARLSGNVIS